MKSTKCFILLLTARVKARIRKDGMSYDDVVEMLTGGIVEAIAKGEVIREIAREKTQRLTVLHDKTIIHLIKQAGSNAWLLSGYEENQMVNQSRGATTSDLRTNSPILSRTDVGASDKTNITQVTTDNNEDTRYSEIFDETDKHSVSEVFNSLDRQTLTDGWNKHLQEVWDSLFEGNIAVPYG